MHAYFAGSASTMAACPATLDFRSAGGYILAASQVDGKPYRLISNPAARHPRLG